MVDPLLDLESMVAANLANQQAPTGEYIRKLIKDLCQLSMFEGVTEDDAERLAKRIEERVSITQNVGPVLVERDHLPWLHAAKVDIDSYYWSRYRGYLIQEGFATAAITTLDEVTDRVLDLMRDPRKSGPGIGGDGCWACTVGQDSQLYGPHMQGRGCWVQADCCHRGSPQQPAKPDTKTN